MNSIQRAHILIPADLLREIDAIVGPRGRSAFLLQTAREEVRRRKLLRFLEGDEPSLRRERRARKSLAELEEDSAAWVRRLRSESESRIPATRLSKPRRKRR
jgi:hypothetical protein